MRSICFFAIAAVCAVCAGCAAFDPQAAHVTKFGPQAVMQQPVDEPDVVSVISSGDQSFDVVRRAGAFEKHESPRDFTKALDEAIAGFYKRGTSEDQRLRRNRVQDRLILASNDGCEAYKTVLKRKQSDRNFEFGTATVLFGAAGAVAQGVTAARNLAALAGATGGIRAEYNRDFFADVAAHVITKGINSRRKEILGAITTGQGKPVADYSLEAALADVVTYHGACSLVGGLEQADGAISKLDTNVGLDALKATVAATTDTRGSIGAVKSHSGAGASDVDPGTDATKSQPGK
jgi:hypothetical protein